MHRRVFHFDSLHLVSSLHGIALTYTCGWTQVNTNNNFFKCSWSHAVNFHDRIMSVLNAVPYEGLNITGIQSCFSVWSLAHRVFSSFSKSFHDAIFKVFTFLRWGTLFWNSSTIYGGLLQTGEPLLIFTLLCLFKMLFYTQSLFPVHLIGFKMFLQLFTFSTAYFSSFLFSSSELFWDTLLSN